jgi:hypothetical protein
MRVGSTTRDWLAFPRAIRPLGVQHWGLDGEIRQVTRARLNRHDRGRGDVQVNVPSGRPDSPYATASLLIRQHGDKAADVAEAEMDALQASGDGDAYAIWGNIYDAIDELQAPTQISLREGSSVDLKQQVV